MWCLRWLLARLCSALVPLPFLVSVCLSGPADRPWLVPRLPRALCQGGRLLCASPFGGTFDVSPSSHTAHTSTGWRARARWPRVRVGMGWIDASPANLRAAFHAAHPVASLESLYRAGFDDAGRFLRTECPGLVCAPYAVRRANTHVVSPSSSQE